MAKDLRLIQGSKSVRMEDLPEDAWRFISGNSGSGDVKSTYSKVAILFRCINARADAAASIPFRLENSRGRAVETSDDWQGGKGWIPHPRQLIRQFFMSMDFTNTVYAARLYNKYRVPKGLQYFLPTTITPKWDENGNLLYFERRAGNTQREMQPEEMFYLWVQDAFTEVGASTSTPVKAAMQAAGVLGSLDAFIQTYFEHGAIDPVIGAIPRNTPSEERERAQGLLNQMVTGIRNAFQIRLVATEDVKLTQPLRNGLDSLKNNNLTQEQRENISLALGVPLSFLLGNQANFATASQEEKTLIRWGVQPRLEILYEALDEQLYKPLGVRLKPDFDNLEMFQEEEVQRGAALSSFLDAVGKAQNKEQFMAAAGVFGYDITVEQADQLFPVKEEKPVEPPAPVVEPPAEPQNRAISELVTWRKKSLNAGKLVTWHSTVIPPYIHHHITEADDWEKAMGEAREMLISNPDESILELAKSLNNLASKSDPAPVNVNITTPPISVTLKNE